MTDGSNGYFGVSATRASMFARLMPSDKPGGSLRFSNLDWHEFIEKYSPLIYGVCRQFKLQSSDAEDIAQDAVLKIMNLLLEEKFAYDSRYKFRSWLATVIRNTVLDSIRKKQRLRTDSGEVLSTVEEESVADDIHRQAAQELLLGQAIEAVKSETRPDHWAIFEQMVLRNRTAPEVSKELGVSMSNIYVVCNRLRAKIADKCTELKREDGSSRPEST